MAETIRAAEPDRCETLVEPQFRYVKLEVAVVAGHEIPVVSGNFAFDGVDQARRSPEADDLLATKKAAQQLIEADEMVQVPMGDEDVGSSNGELISCGSKYLDIVPNYLFRA